MFRSDKRDENTQQDRSQISTDKDKYMLQVIDITFILWRNANFITYSSMNGDFN